MASFIASSLVFPLPIITTPFFTMPHNATSVWSRECIKIILTRQINSGERTYVLLALTNSFVSIDSERRKLVNKIPYIYRIFLPNAFWPCLSSNMKKIFELFNRYRLWFYICYNFVVYLPRYCICRMRAPRLRVNETAVVCNPCWESDCWGNIWNNNNISINRWIRSISTSPPFKSFKVPDNFLLCYLAHLICDG